MELESPEEILRQRHEIFDAGYVDLGELEDSAGMPEEFTIQWTHPEILHYTDELGTIVFGGQLKPKGHEFCSLFLNEKDERKHGAVRYKLAAGRVVKWHQKNGTTVRVHDDRKVDHEAFERATERYLAAMIATGQMTSYPVRPRSLGGMLRSLFRRSLSGLKRVFRRE